MNLARLDRAWELVDTSFKVGSVAVVAFALLLSARSPSVLVAGWAALTVCAHLLGPIGHRARERDPAPGDDRWRFRLNVVMAAVGLAWAIGLCATAFFHTDPVTRLSATAFAMGLATAGTVFNAAFRRGFWLMNGFALLPLGIGEMLTGDPVFMVLGGALAMNLGFLWMMHREIQRDLLSSLQGRLRLEHLATHDPLTGLPNRAALAPALDSALRAESGRVGVLYIDLDRFKVVNDSLGHDAGDRLLIEVTERYRALVGEAATLYRVGGDELVALVAGAPDEARISDLADRLHGALAEPVQLGERALQISASIGIATGPNPGDSGRDLLRHADAALYRAKDNGRNRIEVFDEALRTRLRQRIDDEVEIRRALDHGEIEPWYQPIVDLRTGAIVGAEALARWRHPRRGVLAAGAFIPIIEDSGLTGPLTNQIVEAVVSDLVRWRQDGVPVLRVKVNLGAEPFARPNLAQWLSELIRDHHCPPDAIGVEVTETSLLRDIALAAEHLRRLRETGLTVALDDFGTAWSSLALLRQLPLDTVKLDRMFIRDLEHQQKDRALVAAVVGMARQLNLDVVAEGIETEGQARVAAALGCDMAQGYLYAPAVSGPKLVEMLGRPPFRPPWSELAEVVG